MSTGCRILPPKKRSVPFRIDDGISFAKDRILRKRAVAALFMAAAIMLGASLPARAADAAFTQFIASLWPEAQAAGVSRATFDVETRGLEPDYKLPDLLLPGRPATGAPSQAEFVQVPADYVKEASIARLAAEGQKLMQKHRAALTAIEIDAVLVEFRRQELGEAGGAGPGRAHVLAAHRALAEDLQC